MVNRRPAATVMAIVFAGTTVLPQGSPVPAIPWDLPDAPRLELEAQREPIMKRIAAYDARVTAFMAKCAHVTDQAVYIACGKENGALGGEEKAIDAAVAALSAELKKVLAAPCLDHERQLRRDQQASRTQLRSIEQGVRELEELAKSAEQERKEAYKLGATTAFGAIGKYLEPKVRSASAFKGWLTRYDKQMRVKGVDVEALKKKIEHTTRGLERAQQLAATGAVLTVLTDLQEAWTRLTTIGEAIGTGLAQGQATFREMLSDPALRPFILDDASMADVHRTLFDIAAGSMPLFAKISPQYTIAAFVVDAGFQYKKYESLRAQVMQRHGLSEQMLKGVEALKQQTERTVAKLQACRRSTPGYPLSASH